MRTHEPRQQQFVNNKVQGALALQLVKHWIIFFCVGCCTTALFKYLLDPFQSFSDVLHLFWKQQGTFLVVAVLLLPAFVLDSIKLSHRIVGPLVRVRSTLHSLATGQQVKPLKFRPNDFWHDLADEFNEVIVRYQDPAAKSQRDGDPDSFATAPADSEPVTAF